MPRTFCGILETMPRRSVQWYEMTFREHQFNQFNPYVLHHLMNKSGLRIHVGYEFDGDLGFLPTNSLEGLPQSHIG
jgi:hypothetical protein